MGTLTPGGAWRRVVWPRRRGFIGGLRKSAVQIAISTAILGFLALPSGALGASAPPARRSGAPAPRRRPAPTAKRPQPAPPAPPEPATAGAYAWPIDAPRRMTSSFGEFRPGHFHGGVDLSTEQRTGRPVYAVADGQVWRVRASGTGYGRALYLRLADGRTAVYGHLAGWNDAISAFVAAAQESLGRYEVDLYPPPGRLPVRRGERVATSGESGAGPPHLHFEMREGADAEIGRNPQRLGFLLPDDAPPVIRRLVVDEPGTPDERTFGTGRRRVVPLRADGASGWRAPDTLVVQGTALFSVETYDPGVGGSRGGPARARLLLDDREVYAVDFDAFDWNRAHEVELCWDAREVAEGHDFVLHLFRPAGARDSRFLAAPEGAGWLDATGMAGGSAPHRGEIRVEDARGHVTRVGFWLRLRPGRAPDRPAVAPAADPDGAAPRTTRFAPGRAGTERLGPATLRYSADTFFSPAELRLAAGLRAVGDTVGGGGGRPWLTLDAPGLVLDAPLRVALRPPAGADARRWGLYLRRPGRSSWAWVGQEADSAGIGGTTRGLGLFELREDRVAPRVVVTAPAAGRPVAGAHPALALTVLDDLAGVTWRTIDVTVDGVPQIVVYDPESDTVSGRSRRALAAGEHTLRVVARDRVGNTTTVTRSFRVAAG